MDTKFKLRIGKFREVLVRWSNAGWKLQVVADRWKPFVHFAFCVSITYYMSNVTYYVPIWWHNVLHKCHQYVLR